MTKPSNQLVSNVGNHSAGDRVILRGLDGGNSLGYLAALGAFRVLSNAKHSERVEMRWVRFEGAWRPEIRTGKNVSKEQIVECIDGAMVTDRMEHPSRFIDYKNNNIEANEFYHACRKGESFDVGKSYWITSLTNDIHPDATSPLQLTRSDYFVGNLDQVLRSTTREHIMGTLFEAWRYEDALSGQSLHLEPTEDRRHAYQWNKPSGDPNRNKEGNVLGANRLAVEAFPLFMGLPSNNPARLLMTGWTGVRSDDATWTWPIWDVWLSVIILPSLLGLAELQDTPIRAESLRARGIGSVYRSRRILVEKTPNLTPAIALL
jgi:CRISPR-associated endonuclease/helicase Cas3